MAKTRYKEMTWRGSLLALRGSSAKLMLMVGGRSRGSTRRKIDTAFDRGKIDAESRDIKVEAYNDCVKAIDSPSFNAASVTGNDWITMTGNSGGHVRKTHLGGGG